MSDSRLFLFSISSRSLFTYIATLMFFFIFYQQVLVVNAGGSFKIYELLGLVLLFFYINSGWKIHGKASAYSLY